MRKERKEIGLGFILLNEGQLPWLPKNPRTWTQSDIDDTRDSILEDPDFLEDRPLLVVPFGKAFVAFAGNLRHEGATAAKLSKVPCVVYHPETAADYETILRRAMKDNGQFGKTDWDAIYSSKWGTLPLEKWGLTPNGWTEPEGGEGNMAGAEGGEGGKMPQAHEDDFNEDEDAIKVRCKPGDIWQLGEHRLLCGDSTKAKNYEILMRGDEARLCVTSPPYGVGKSYEEAGIGPWKETIYPVIENVTSHARIVVWNIADLFATGTQFIEPTSMYSTQKMADCGFLMMYARIWKKPGGNFAGTNPYYTVSMKPVQEYEWILGYAKKDYEKDYAPIINWLGEQAKIAGLKNEILKDITGAGFMYGHWFTSHQWAMIDEKNYLAIQDYCRAHKIQAFARDYNDLRREYENLNIYGKILTKEDESNWGQYGVWEIAPVNKRTGGHPAEFPVELPARCIKMHSRKGDIILEPFCGAGTTLIAAEQLGRICYGMELDPHYCDIILARWEKLTGRKAEKVNN